MTVVGSVIAPKIVVSKMGFSIRAGTHGDTVSYGLVLTNTSTKYDAINVTVLVNLVDEDDVLYGSARTRIAEIPAGGAFALGDYVRFPGEAPVDRLEPVVQVEGRVHLPSIAPKVDNLRLIPNQRDEEWLHSLEGEVINDHPTLRLRRAIISVVVFDEDDQVLGGGVGHASATLPPGSRQFFKVFSGLSSIEFGQAAYAIVSVTATYDRPDSG
jgi:hypothetical protein